MPAVELYCPLLSTGGTISSTEEYAPPVRRIPLLKTMRLPAPGNPLAIQWALCCENNF